MEARTPRMTATNGSICQQTDRPLVLFLSFVDVFVCAHMRAYALLYPSLAKDMPVHACLHPINTTKGRQAGRAGQSLVLKSIERLFCLYV